MRQYLFYMCLFFLNVAAQASFTSKDLKEVFTDLEGKLLEENANFLKQHPQLGCFGDESECTNQWPRHVDSAITYLKNNLDKISNNISVPQLLYFLATAHSVMAETNSTNNSWSDQEWKKYVDFAGTIGSISGFFLFGVIGNMVASRLVLCGWARKCFCFPKESAIKLNTIQEEDDITAELNEQIEKPKD